ncbi:HOM2 [Sanghuangporus sanghuang]
MLEGRQLKVGVLGATGTVGQRFISLLGDHPFFVVHALGASPRSAGKPYEQVVQWKLSQPIPSYVRGIVVKECKPQNFADCVVIFSGLDASVAGDIETAFRAAEFAVFSNSKNHRRDPDVPLLVPLVNPYHLAVIPYQRSLHSPPLERGFIVTNANCSTTGVVVPLAALERAFGPLDAVLVTTMQAISGAGYPGIPSLDILDNVVPYISGEEEKIQWEVLKILGGIVTDADDKTKASRLPGQPTPKTFDMHASHPLRISAACNRVPVLDGHLATVSVRFVRRPPPSPQQVREALEQFTTEARHLGCPSAPRTPIVLHDAPDRPQPRLDRDYEKGSGVAVGRVRQCPVLDIKFVVLANNVCIGAATSSIMNAELSIAKGLIQV